MRMKSALTVLQAAGELDGLEGLPLEMLVKAQAAAAAAGAGGSSAGGGKGKGKAAAKDKAKAKGPAAGPSGSGSGGKGKGKAREVESAPPASDDGLSSDDDDESESDGGLSYDGADDGNGNRDRLYAPRQMTDSDAAVDGFANDDLYSHRSPPSARVGTPMAGPPSSLRPPGPPSMTAPSTFSYGHPSSSSSSMPMDVNHAAAGSSSAYPSLPLPAYATAPATAYYDPTPPRPSSSSSTSVGAGAHASLPPRSAYGALPPSINHAVFPAPHSTPYLSQHPSPYPPSHPHPHAQHRSPLSYPLAAPPPLPPLTQPSNQPSSVNPFDDLIPLRSSSKSLSTLFRPRGVPGASTSSADGTVDGSSAEPWRSDVVSQGLVSEPDARLLFAAFMSRIAPNIYLLDPILYTHGPSLPFPPPLSPSFFPMLTPNPPPLRLR